MGWISTIFVHKAIDLAIERSPARESTRQSLYRLVDVAPNAPIDPKQMITDDRFFALLERLAMDFEHGASIPLLIGASMKCDDYGAFGLAFKSAHDLMASYRRVERFGKVVTSIANFRVLSNDQTVLMEVIPAKDLRLGLSLTNELALAAAWSLTQEVSAAPFLPKAVYISRQAPIDETSYRTHFRCPIEFGSNRDALEINFTEARRPNRLADNGIAQFFEAHLESELSSMGDQTSLERRILNHIGSSLSQGAPSLTEVADALGMSARTLQRRLSDKGVVYQDLVSQARKDLSEQLLRKTDYALAEIAFLAGFSDQSTFTRAFKRWHDCTPASYRRGD